MAAAEAAGPLLVEADVAAAQPAVAGGREPVGELVELPPVEPVEPPVAVAEQVEWPPAAAVGWFEPAARG